MNRTYGVQRKMHYISHTRHTAVCEEVKREGKGGRGEGGSGAGQDGIRNYRHNGLEQSEPNRTHLN